MKHVNYNPDFVYSGIYKAGNFTGTIVIRSCGIEIEKSNKVHLFTWNEGKNPEKLKSLISGLYEGLPVEICVSKGNRLLDVQLGRAMK